MKLNSNLELSVYFGVTLVTTSPSFNSEKPECLLLTVLLIYDGCCLKYAQYLEADVNLLRFDLLVNFIVECVFWIMDYWQNKIHLLY